MTQLARGLKRALASARNVVVVYSDLSRIPLWTGSRSHTLESHRRAILDACPDRTVLFPTFNWDFCETGRYDPTEDEAQTGALAEYVRQKAPARTLTPVYSFAVAQTADGITPPTVSTDAFGEDSTFSWLIDRRATVLVYGAPLHNASALHVAEQDARVPYRYHKSFEGTIEGHGPVTFNYFVRPQDGSVRYHWPTVDQLMDPLFTWYDVGVGSVGVVCAARVFRRLRQALSVNEHIFLEEPPFELYKRYGKPLRYETVEEAA